jgi:hypothetical protein
LHQAGAGLQARHHLHRRSKEASHEVRESRFCLSRLRTSATQICT